VPPVIALLIVPVSILIRPEAGFGSVAFPNAKLKEPHAGRSQRVS